jgi:hypothetical protein
MKKDYLKYFKLDTYWKKEKTTKQDGQKAYSELWNNAVCEMETGRTVFV